MIIIKSPLSVPISKGKLFKLGLNQYRNTHYRTLNTAKINYKAIMAEQIQKLPKMESVEIFYRLYPGTRHKSDLDNIISVHAKFFQDALVEFGILPEDNYTVITGSAQSFGEVDKDDPRVEIMVVENNMDIS